MQTWAQGGLGFRSWQGPGRDHQSPNLLASLRSIPQQKIPWKTGLANLSIIRQARWKKWGIAKDFLTMVLSLAVTVTLASTLKARY